MGSYINPGSFSNAFNLQRQMGAQQRQQDADNAFRTSQVERQDRLDTEARDKDAQEQARTAFPRVGQIAAQISGLQDPQQKRLAFKQAILQNSALFDTMGMPHTEALAKLDQTDDATLDATLAKLSSFAPQAAATDVAPGHSLVRGDGKGGFTAAYTAPSAPGEGGDGFSLSPGQVRFDKTGKRIASVEQPAGMDPEQAKIAAQLRDDWRQDSKVFVGVADAYQRLTDSAASPSGAGDVALLFNYLKVLDPGSTVREGEFATVGAAGGLPTQVQGLFNKMVNGKLPDSLRSDIVNRGTRLYRGQEARFKSQVMDRYKGLAKRYGIAEDEFSDPRAAVPTSALPQTNEKGWVLHIDDTGARAYVSPDGKQFDEVR